MEDNYRQLEELSKHETLAVKTFMRLGYFNGVFGIKVDSNRLISLMEEIVL